MAEPCLPKAIEAQLADAGEPWIETKGMAYDSESSDIKLPATAPIFFEWQRLDWIFKPGEDLAAAPPYGLYVNGSREESVTCKRLAGHWLLSGSVNLGNAVGKTHFSIRDAHGKYVFTLGAEVYPQKLDYKKDFPVMVEEITEVIYSLAFDLFKKTYASTKSRTTYNQTLSEWMNLYRVLADSFQQSIDTILRAPKYELKAETKVKSVDLVKRTNRKALVRALKSPSIYSRGGGVKLAEGLRVSHLEEQHKRVSYDTHENRFVVWAIRDVIKKLDLLVSGLKDRKGVSDTRIVAESAVLRNYQRKLRFRLLDSTFADVGVFNNQCNFSTTLTMAPGYKEFYRRYLLLRKGLAIADNELFQMDYKDIATLYEYWCFLKTVKILRDSPNYELSSSDVVKIEHQKFAVNLKKGKRSEVHLVQRSTGDQISLYYNREFSRQVYTHTFTQTPDNFIEFSRSGYSDGKDKRIFKVLLDAKYRFDRESAEYPESQNPFGPPLDAIAQLHRYRDAILWEQDVEDSVKLANKSLGGVILFPYPNDELEFRTHPFYQSIERVNIGAIPLQPGAHRRNQLYKSYLDSLFEESGESINERRIRYDARRYNEKRDAERDLVMIGWVPSEFRSERLAYHLGLNLYYTRWKKGSAPPFEKVKAVALFDASNKEIIAFSDVKSVQVMLGKELAETGTTWPPTEPLAQHWVYSLAPLKLVSLPCGDIMRQERERGVGGFFVSRLGLELALEYENPDLLFMPSWDKYREWKRLITRHKSVVVHRSRHFNVRNYGLYDLSFSVE
jgi:predicted component of viral defense system (DUF524 family)